MLGWLQDLLQRKSTTGRAGASLTPFRMLHRCDGCLMISGDLPCGDKVPETRQACFSTEAKRRGGTFKSCQDICCICSLDTVLLLFLFCFFKIYFTCMNVLSACTRVHHINAWCLWKSGENIRSPGTGVTVILGIEPKSSARAARALNHGAISPAHIHKLLHSVYSRLCE